jgi:hypothetical protein
VTIHQVYRNLGSDTLNCVYEFPMDERAAVNELTVTVGDRVIQGVVRGRAQAAAMYVVCFVSLVQQSSYNISQLVTLRPWAFAAVTPTGTLLLGTTLQWIGAIVPRCWSSLP